MPSPMEINADLKGSLIRSFLRKVGEYNIDVIDIPRLAHKSLLIAVELYSMWAQNTGAVFEDFYETDRDEQSVWCGIAARVAVEQYLAEHEAVRTVLNVLNQGFLIGEQTMSKQGNSDDNKAPTTGGNSSDKRDDKATADGQPVNPNRPHTDK